MTVRTERMTRRFKFDGRTLADPDPKLTPDQVRETYAAAYPELGTAAIEGPEATADGQQIYTFTRAIGAKG